MADSEPRHPPGTERMLDDSSDGRPVSEESYGRRLARHNLGDRAYDAEAKRMVVAAEEIRRGFQESRPAVGVLLPNGLRRPVTIRVQVYFGQIVHGIDWQTQGGSEAGPQYSARASAGC